MFGANIYHLLLHLKLKQYRAIDVIAMKANKLLNSPKRIYIYIVYLEALLEIIILMCYSFRFSNHDTELTWITKWERNMTIN